MNKKVLILSGSPRKGGNSDISLDERYRKAKALAFNSAVPDGWNIPVYDDTYA